MNEVRVKLEDVAHVIFERPNEQIGFAVEEWHGEPTRWYGACSMTLFDGYPRLLLGYFGGGCESEHVFNEEQMTPESIHDVLVDYFMDMEGPNVIEDVYVEASEWRSWNHVA